MKKAVIIFAHRSAEQIAVLTEQLLADNRTDVYIHIDKKSDHLRHGIPTNDHVFISDRNIEVTWGDDTMVKALLIMLEEVVNTPFNYEYIIICTGQDLVVKPGLDTFLEENRGKIFLEASKDEPGRRDFLMYSWPACFCRHLGNRTNPLRILRSLWFRLIRLGLVKKKRIPAYLEHLAFWKSFNWSAMPLEVASHLLESINQDPGILALYYGSLLPEDGFLGTMIMNSKFKDRVWYDPECNITKSLTIHNGLVDGQHIWNMTREDVPRIDASECFFARKFDIHADPELVHFYRDRVVHHSSPKGVAK